MVSLLPTRALRKIATTPKKQPSAIAHTLRLGSDGLTINGQTIPVYIGTDVEVTEYIGGDPLKVVNVGIFTEHLDIEPLPDVRVTTTYE